MSIIGIIYTFLAVIDRIVYNIASTLFTIIIEIADKPIFKETQVQDITNRVYVVLGVLILFKLVISAIQYMINPDSFEDKEKGMAGILKKTAISITLIAVVPAIFSFLMDFQTIVVQNIPKLILNKDYTETDIDKAGTDLSMSVLLSFVRVREATATNGLSGNTENEIKDTDSFVKHIADNCPNIVIFGSPDKRECKYEYMVIISTICGGFLCYVLMIMLFDVVIRTIKIGLIQMLAPIPISSYVVSSDKLKKFGKLAMSVYVDLFIRLAIVFLIIATVQAIIESDYFNVDTNGNWFKSVVIHVAMIFGLLMFAKNAPKFLTELLGLPEAGTGDFKDMFSPSRLTGAAGALINPARNAVSNWKSGWDNAPDARNKFTRGLSALRHAAGGAARGTLDSGIGLVKGENWSGIGKRHDASAARSARHSAEAYMRRTDRATADNTNTEILRRRSEIEAEFKAQGIDISDLTKKSRLQARAELNTRMDSLNNNIQSINRQLASGIDANTGARLTSEREQELRSQLSDNVAELNRLNTKEGANDWIEARSKEIASEKAEQAALNEIRGIDNRVSNNKRRMAQIRLDLQNSNLSAEDRRAKEAEMLSLATETTKLESQITPEAQEAIYNKYRDSMKELDKIRKDHYTIDAEGNEVFVKVKPQITRGSVALGKADAFFGGEGFTGKGYIDIADVLSSNREKLWQKEAMGKLEQAPSILKDKATGVEPTFSLSDVTLGYKLKKDFTYSVVSNYYTKLQAGTLTQADLDNLDSEYGIKTSGDLKAAFKDVEKQAASRYVKMANDGQIDNPAIVEGVKRMTSLIASANIPRSEKQRLLKDLSEDPGKFLKNASTVQELLRTKGSRISAFNSGKKDGQ